MSTIILADLSVPYSATHDAQDGRWYRVAAPPVCANCDGTGRDDAVEGGQCLTCWEERPVAWWGCRGVYDRHELYARNLETLCCEECAGEFDAATGWAADRGTGVEYRCGPCFEHHDLRVTLDAALYEDIPSGRDRQEVIEGVVALVRRGWVVERKEVG